MFRAMVPNPETGRLEPAPLAYPDATTAHKGLMTRAQAALVAQLGTDTGWLLPAYSPNWSDYAAGEATVAYRKDATGRLWLKGLAKKAVAIVANDTIFTLPSGYRPANDHLFGVASAAGFCVVFINGTGGVTIQSGGSATWTSLAGVSFDPAT